MSAIAKSVYRIHRFSVDDYHRMGDIGVLGPEDRVELIEGEIVDMAPIGSRHAGMVKHLATVFHEVVGRKAIISVQDPLVLDERNEPQPDIMLLRWRADFYRASHPRPDDVLLLIEVAETSITYDEERKLPLYAAAHIPEVWIVDLENALLRVFRKPAGGGYIERQDLEAPSGFAPEALPGLIINLTGIFDF
jgi:Uma2 family endonuclease